jgi:hypothetical protein
MRTVVTDARVGQHPAAQRITNMERLAPGFAEPSTDSADKITLVLTRDQRAFSEYCRQVKVQAGTRLRRITGSRDLHGLHPDKVQIVTLPDWQESMSDGEADRVGQMIAATFPFPLAGPDPLLATAGRLQKPSQSPSLPTVSRSRIITVERVAAGGGPILSRVRMGRTKERKGLIDSDPLDVVTTQYLDGKALRVASTRKYFQEDEVAFDAVPARTKDITDFGRLTTAAKSLAVSMAAYGPDNEPSSEQLAVFIAGYRNLLEWRRKVRQQMTRAEGEIDAVETLLTQIL